MRLPAQWTKRWDFSFSVFCFIYPVAFFLCCSCAFTQNCHIMLLWRRLWSLIHTLSKFIHCINKLGKYIFNVECRLENPIDIIMWGAWSLIIFFFFCSYSMVQLNASLALHYHCLSMKITLKKKNWNAFLLLLHATVAHYAHLLPIMCCLNRYPASSHLPHYIFLPP